MWGEAYLPQGDCTTTFAFCFFRAMIALPSIRRRQPLLCYIISARKMAVTADQLALRQAAEAAELNIFLAATAREVLWLTHERSCRINGLVAAHAARVGRLLRQ